jgi:site-specific DNA recombinase
MNQKRAAIYKRVSTIEQAKEGYSLDSQEKNLQKYCSFKNYHVVGIYADEGISGKDTINRPSYMSLMSDAKERKFDIVVIWTVSRLSRSVADLYNTWKMLNQYGIEIESQSECFDTSSAMGRAMFGIIAVFSQLESDITSERVKNAARERAEQGKRTCNEVLGYDVCGKDTFAVNERESEIVKYIFDKFVEFRSFSAIAECCKLKCYTGKRGRELKAESVKKILRCPLYVSYNRFLGELYKGQHEPIIELSIYNKVQRLIGGREVNIK